MTLTITQSSIEYKKDGSFSVQITLSNGQEIEVYETSDEDIANEKQEEWGNKIGTEYTK